SARRPRYIVAGRDQRCMRDELLTTAAAPASKPRADHRTGERGDFHRMLLDVSRATASHRDLPSLLRDLAGLLRRVASFDGLGLVLHDPASDVMRGHTLVGLRPVLRAENGLSVAESPTGLLWQTPQPLRVPPFARET